MKRISLLLSMLICVFALHAQVTFTLRSGLMDGNYANTMAVQPNGTTWFSSQYATSFDGTTWADHAGGNGVTVGGSVGNTSCIAADHTGKVWIGTSAGLVSYVGTTYTAYTTTSTGNGLPNNVINGLKTDANNNLWIVTPAGLTKYNGTSWTTYSKTNGNFPTNAINRIAIDANNNLWLTTNDTGLVQFDGTNWTNYNIHNSGITTNATGVIAIDPTTGTKWLAVGTGVQSFDGTTWTSYNTSNSGITTNSIYSITVDRLGRKWFGGPPATGVIMYDGTTWSSYTPFNTAAFVDDQLFPSAYFNVLGSDSSGNVWLMVSTVHIYTIAVAAPTCAVVSPGTVTSTGGNSGCGSVTTTLSLTGTNPSSGVNYQWKISQDSINWTNVATTPTVSGTISATTYYKCVVSCATGASKDSTAGYKITITPTATPTVSIAASPTGAICTGTSVTFTPTVTNGGTTPVYVWKKGTTVVGGNTATYTDNTLANGDAITCTVTSNAGGCISTAPVTSSPVTMTVSTSVTPTVTVTPTPGSTVCAGTPVTFTPTITNGGTTPVYVWKKGTTVVGGNTATYTDNNPADQEAITCTITSNAGGCTSTAPVVSSPVTMTVNASVIPNVTITATPSNTICAGTVVTFIANATNGGGSPTYIWKVNGAPTGTSYTYTGNLNNNDIVTVEMTSNATCASPTVATSTGITMAVTPQATPTVSITVNPNGAVCAGNTVTFNAIPANEGTAPQYVWKKNGTQVGTATTYSDYTLKTGDIITCDLTSNATCLTTPAANNTAPSMQVNPLVLPSVTVSANPGNIVTPGQTVTFTANIVNGGNAPSVQWYKNGVAVGGAVGTTYSSNSLENNDSITCNIISNDPCAVPNTAASAAVIINMATGINAITGTSNDLSLYPNPNKGFFTISATIANSNEAQIEVVNAVGQVMYSNILPVVKGHLKGNIQLPSVAAGMYMLRVHTNDNTSVLRFVITE